MSLCGMLLLLASLLPAARDTPAMQAPAAAQKAEAPATLTVSEKQKKLMEDSEKLVQMAAELKVSVDKAGKNELSLDVIRKAEAVEKLARSLKERIREAR